MKACPSCGARNAERSQFCNECGQRLPARSPKSASVDPSETGEPNTAQADPVSGVVQVTSPPFTAPVAKPMAAPAAARSAAPATTPATPSLVPGSGASCGACGFVLPSGETASWCPGCGALFDEPPSAAPVAGPRAAVRTEAPDRTREARTRDTEPPEPVVVPPGWGLVLLKAGERLDRFSLRRESTVFGRTEGDITFPDDPHLSPRHARIVLRGGGFWLEDAGSRNGLYVRLREAGQLADKDMVTFGSLVFRFESFGPGPRTSSIITQADGVKVFGSGRERPFGRLVRILQDGSEGCAYPLTPSRTILGRKSGHFVFPDDPLLSRQHVQFYERDGTLWVEDLGSSNGTLVRMVAPVELRGGTVFRMGDVTMEVTAP